MKVDLWIQDRVWVLRTETGAQMTARIEGDSEKVLANAIQQLPRLVARLAEIGVKEIKLVGFRRPGTAFTEAEWVFLHEKGYAPFEDARQQALKIAEESGIRITGTTPVVSIDEIANAVNSETRRDSQGKDLFDFD